MLHGHTGVCEKKVLRRRRHVDISGWKTPNQGLERSFWCCIPWPRLEQKECFCQRHRYQHQDWLWCQGHNDDWTRPTLAVPRRVAAVVQQSFTEFTPESISLSKHNLCLILYTFVYRAAGSRRTWHDEAATRKHCNTALTHWNGRNRTMPMQPYGEANAFQCCAYA